MLFCFEGINESQAVQSATNNALNMLADSDETHVLEKKENVAPKQESMKAKVAKSNELRTAAEKRNKSKSASSLVLSVKTPVSASTPWSAQRQESLSLATPIGQTAHGGTGSGSPKTVESTESFSIIPEGTRQSCFMNHCFGAFRMVGTRLSKTTSFLCRG